MKKSLLYRALTALGLQRIEQKLVVSNDNERWDKEGINIQLSGDMITAHTVSMNYAVHYIKHAVETISNQEMTEEIATALRIYKRQLEAIQEANMGMQDAVFEQYPNSFVGSRQESLNLINKAKRK